MMYRYIEMSCPKCGQLNEYNLNEQTNCNRCKHSICVMEARNGYYYRTILGEYRDDLFVRYYRNPDKYHIIRSNHRYYRDGNKEMIYEKNIKLEWHSTTKELNEVNFNPHVVIISLGQKMNRLIKERLTNERN